MTVNSIVSDGTDIYAFIDTGPGDHVHVSRLTGLGGTLVATDLGEVMQYILPNSRTNLVSVRGSCFFQGRIYFSALLDVGGSFVNRMLQLNTSTPADSSYYSQFPGVSNTVDVVDAMIATEDRIYFTYRLRPADTSQDYLYYVT